MQGKQQQQQQPVACWPGLDTHTHTRIRLSAWQDLVDTVERHTLKRLAKKGVNRKFN